MADLGTLALGTFTNVSNTAITGAEPVLQLIASADDAKDVHDTSNSTHTGEGQFALGDVPADFGSMATLAVRLRYALQSGTQVNAWNSLTAIIRDAAGTALTDEVTLASNITTTTPTNSGVVGFTLTAAGLAATKADWDAATARIRFAISKSKGGDSLEERVFAAELTGTYTVSSTTFAGAGSASATGTAALSTSITLAGAGSAAGTGAAALTTEIALAGSGAATGAGSGALITAITLTASAAAAGTGTATLTTAIVLSGAGAGAATGSGTLAAEDLLLSGAGAATGQGTAALSTSITLAGAGSAVAAGTSALSTQITLAASGASAMSGAGTLQTQITLAGIGAAVATGSGSLAEESELTLSGAGAAVGIGIASLATQITLSGAGSMTATGQGVLVVPAPFSVPEPSGPSVNRRARTREEAFYYPDRYWN